MCWALVPSGYGRSGPTTIVPKTQRSSSHPSLSRPLWRACHEAHRSRGCFRAKCISCHWLSPVPVQLLCTQVLPQYISEMMRAAADLWCSATGEQQCAAQHSDGGGYFTL
ncbi:hypothetical protein KUCAC02_029198 [Chaenocephalus aceratus]|uniref:Uncharacterized protein n=1 Tax=Chaenocephalus aceratus TaxID=36190 RepID=A0ACB9X5X8_CHAAC|nr:hypothetical protein KUCAC02_029198 [Chaenocephalus aceratus]